jgi:voltage-gated potassium channel
MIERRYRSNLARIRRRIHYILDTGLGADKTTILVHQVLILMVLISVSSVVLESVPRIAARYGEWFTLIEIAAVVVFTLEYALRFWSAPDHTPYSGMTPIAARWTFVKTPSALVDLFTVLPMYLSFFVAADLKVLLLLRLLRFFKLARYSPGMRSLVAVLEAERKALVASAVVLFGLVLVAASAMHLVEHDAQPDRFGTIPDAMWWAVVTLTTVGYGDAIPATLAGRLVASVTMFMGLMMIALPVGIVATAFAEEIHKREFVVTWGMIARVPLFGELDASEIAEIMRYLRAQSAPIGQRIVRRGEIAQSMYFIAAGEVTVELPHKQVKLGEGQFFGEVALLRRTRRTATVRASQPTKLLVLDAGDLHLLMERNPELGKRIEQVVQERSLQHAKGDILAAEISPSDHPSEADF